MLLALTDAHHDRNHVDARFRVRKTRDWNTTSQQSSDLEIEPMSVEKDDRASEVTSTQSDENVHMFVSVPAFRGSQVDNGFGLLHHDTRHDTELGTSFNPPLEVVADASSRDGFHFPEQHSFPSNNSSYISGNADSQYKKPSMPLDRFEAYVKDNMGSFAPTFNGSSTTESSSGATYSTATSENSFREGSNFPITVDLSSRSTVALEQQVNSLDAADMDYLKSKGANGIPDTGQY